MAKQKEKKASSKFLENTWVKAFLALMAAALMFMGPTYFLHILQRFNIPYALLVLLCLASFMFGVILFAGIISKKKKS